MAKQTKTTSERTSLLSKVTNATIAADRSDEALKEAVIAAGGNQADVADAYRKGRYIRQFFPSATKITGAMTVAADQWRTAKASERSEAEQAFYKAVNVAWSRLLKAWGIDSTDGRAGNTNAKGKKGKAKKGKAKKAELLPTAKSPTSVAEYYNLQCAAWVAYMEKNIKHLSDTQINAIKDATAIVRNAFPDNK